MGFPMLRACVDEAEAIIKSLNARIKQLENDNIAYANRLDELGPIKGTGKPSYAELEDRIGKALAELEGK